MSAIGYSKGYAPSLDVRKSCIPLCCFSAPNGKGLWKVCEFEKDFFLFFFLFFWYENWLCDYTPGSGDSAVVANTNSIVIFGGNIERRFRDHKVAGSSPCRSGGRIFFSRVNFVCWLLFRYPFHPRVTAVARKWPRSVCEKVHGRLQPHAPYLCGFE